MCGVDVAIVWPSTSRAWGLIPYELLLLFLFQDFLKFFFYYFFFGPAKLACSISQKSGFRVALIAQEYFYYYYFY